MWFVWIFVVLSTQIAVTNAIQCFDCETDDGSNCNTGNCTAPAACISENCADKIVRKTCYRRKEETGEKCFLTTDGCTMCTCKSDFCNKERPQPLKKVICSKHEGDDYRYECEEYTCRVQACTPQYSSKITMKTRIKSECYTGSKYANGCKNESKTFQGIDYDCTYCNCDTDLCNMDPPEDVKKYHEKLLESRKPLQCYKCANQNGVDCTDEKKCDEDSDECTMVYNKKSKEVTKYCSERSDVKDGCVGPPEYVKGTAMEDMIVCTCRTLLCNYNMTMDGSPLIPPIKATVLPPPTPEGHGRDRDWGSSSVIIKPSGLLIYGILAAIAAIWGNIRG